MKHTCPHSAEHRAERGGTAARPIGCDRSQSGHARLTQVNRAAPHVRPHRIKCGEGWLGHRALMAVQLRPPPHSLPPPRGGRARASGRGNPRARGARRGTPRPPGCLNVVRGAGGGQGCMAAWMDGKETSLHFVYPGPISLTICDSNVILILSIIYSFIYI
jgi:hypothetical protein